MEIETVSKNAFSNIDFECISSRLLTGSDNGKEGRQRKHGSLLPPSNIRALICGPSACGKTNLMFTLLCDQNALVFSHVYVFSKSLFQPKYRLLERILTETEEVGCSFFGEREEVPHPTEVKEHSVMIFDDVACENQSNIREYFTMGRHSNVDSFYLCQTYTRIPKHLVRDNANLVILFRQDDTNLRHVYNDHVTTDLTYTQFKNLCTEAWKNKHDYLVIDKDSCLKDRYRINFNRFYRPSSSG